MTFRKKGCRFLGILLSVMLCLSTVAMAADATYFQEDDHTLQVTVPAAEGEYVTVNVTKEGYTLADVTPDNVGETHVYQNLGIADASGKVIFHIGLTEAAKYTMYYKAGEAAVAELSLELVDLSEIFDTVKEALSSEEKTEEEKQAAVEAFYSEAKIQEIVGEKAYDVSDEAVESYLPVCLAESLAAEEDETVAAKKAYDTAVLLAAVNNGMADNLFEATDYIDFEASELAEWYKESCVTEAVQKKATAYAAGEKPASMAEMMTALTEGLILAVVEEPDGVENAKNIMDDFKDLIGITPSSDLDDYAAVAEKEHADLEALKDAFDAAKEEEEDDDDDSSGSSGGSSGGGRGSSGGSSSAVRFDPVVLPQGGAQTLPTEIYTDLGDAAWATEYIVTLTEKGIVSGKGDGKFYPNDNVTREEFTKMIVAAFAPSAEAAAISFSDVSADAWYYEFVAKAYSDGFITGYDDGRFGVGDLITREDMAVIAFRASQRQPQGGEIYFNDNASISDYAMEAVTELSSLGVITGYNDNFEPKAPATRAQAAKIISLLLQL